MTKSPISHRGPPITWGGGHSLNWRDLFYTVVDRYRLPEIQLYKHIREMALQKLADLDGWDERIADGEFSSLDGTPLDYALNIGEAQSLYESDVNRVKHWRLDSPEEAELVYNNALGWAVFWSVRHPTLSLRELWARFDTEGEVLMTKREREMFFESGRKRDREAGDDAA